MVFSSRCFVFLCEFPGDNATMEFVYGFLGEVLPTGDVSGFSNGFMPGWHNRKFFSFIVWSFYPRPNRQRSARHAKYFFRFSTAGERLKQKSEHSFIHAVILSDALAPIV